MDDTTTTDAPEPQRGIALPGGIVATTLEQAWENCRDQLYASRRGRPADVEVERDWIIWTAGAEAGMKLVVEMGKGLEGVEQLEAMQLLYGELGKLIARKNNTIATRAALAQDRARRGKLQ